MGCRLVMQFAKWPNWIWLRLWSLIEPLNCSFVVSSLCISRVLQASQLNFSDPSLYLYDFPTISASSGMHLISGCPIRSCQFVILHSNCYSLALAPGWLTLCGYYTWNHRDEVPICWTLLWSLQRYVLVWSAGSRRPMSCTPHHSFLRRNTQTLSCTPRHLHPDSALLLVALDWKHEGHEDEVVFQGQSSNLGWVFSSDSARKKPASGLR